MLISTPVTSHAFADFLVRYSHWSLCSPHLAGRQESATETACRQFYVSSFLLQGTAHGLDRMQTIPAEQSWALSTFHVQQYLRGARNVSKKILRLNGQRVSTLSEIKIRKDFSWGKECCLSLLHFDKWGSLASKKSRETSVVPIIFFAPTGMTASCRTSPAEQQVFHSPISKHFTLSKTTCELTYN